MLSKQTGRKTIIQMARIAHTLRGRKLKAALSCRPCCRAVMFFAARNYCAFVQNLCHVGVSLHGAAHTHTHRYRAVVIDWKTSLQHTQNSLATSHAPLPSPCCACCNCLKAFAICYNALRSALLLLLWQKFCGRKMRVSRV